MVVKDLIIKTCMDIQGNVAPIAGHAAWASNDRLETRVGSRLSFRVWLINAHLWHAYD